MKAESVLSNRVKHSQSPKSGLLAQASLAVSTALSSFVDSWR